MLTEPVRKCSLICTVLVQVKLLLTQMNQLRQHQTAATIKLATTQIERVLTNEPVAQIPSSNRFSNST